MIRKIVVIPKDRSIASHYDSICAERGRALNEDRPDPYSAATIEDTRKLMWKEARKRWAEQ